MNNDAMPRGVGAGDLDPVTGLADAWDDFYQVPYARHSDFGSFAFKEPASAVHSVHLAPGLTLDFFAKLEPARELIVTFPGAVPVGKKAYPTFWRVSTFRKAEPALLAFADPTILLDLAAGMRLGWFLGGPGFDPAPLALDVIRRALRETGAESVIFVGGSGGGLPALRLASMLPGSMAYVHEGVTNVAKSARRNVDPYFASVWPDWGEDSLIYAFPERFDMIRHYERTSPDNFVYFAQSVDDSRFIRDHYSPFKESFGISGEDGVSRDGRRQFALYKGEVPGHGKVTVPEFRYHFGVAREAWRAWRREKFLV